MNRMVLMNPGPANTTAAVKLAMADSDCCPREAGFIDILADVHRDLARAAGHPDWIPVLFPGSGTSALEAALCSLVPPDGRVLIVSNGSYGERLGGISAANAIPHDILRWEPGQEWDPADIRSRLASGPFSHLAMVHHETSTGQLNPIAEIGKICRSADCRLIVDAMSSFGGLPVDWQAAGCDIIVTSPNKCLQAMPGLGIVFCRRSILEQLTPIAGRPLTLSLVHQHGYFVDHGEMRFTPPVPTVLALRQAMVEYFQEGPEQRHSRYRECFEILDSGMTARGFRRTIPFALLSGILTSYHLPRYPGFCFQRFHDLLIDRGFTIYPGKLFPAIRLANLGDIHPGDIRRFLAAVDEVVDILGIPAP